MKQESFVIELLPMLCLYEAMENKSANGLN